ncbi:MAG TPA: hypothetical protein VNZ04_00695 [Trinickia sp.]|jgi:hypothetical protein|nr:hypothetical protein [Trinickia sp.]
MKPIINACAAAIAAGALTAVASIAFAQNSPGVPGGILNDQFQLPEHPQMQFAASAPSNKYQNHTSELRKKGDLGDPDGCNLKCPDGQ